MTRFFVAFTLVASLTGCIDGTNPFQQTTTTPTSTTDQSQSITTTPATTETPASTATSNTGDPITSDRSILPGTTSPSASETIFRREARITGGSSTTSNYGNGYAESVSYNGTDDTFTVDNIAFDGAGPYTVVRNGAGNRLGIGPFSVFENQATVADTLTASSIGQLNYRALYGVGPDGNTSIAIIRTGAYVEYGFGGYIYQRNGGVTLPTSGQARYTGTNNYGGLRDFSGRGGLEYVNGDMEVNIDFNDFNDGSGVKGTVTNRRVFDMNGTDVTSDILTAFGTGTTQLPILRFVIEPGVLDSNGEVVGEIRSDDPRDGTAFETGNYYAVLSGNNANTITGVIVVTSKSPRYGIQIDVRETAGFFAVRQ